MTESLAVEDVWYTYPRGPTALRGVNLSLRGGEVALLLGPNGCGKTTLLLVAAGLLKPDRGRVLVLGRSVYPPSPEVRRHIGVVFQDPDDQLFNPTVYDEIAFAPRQLGYSEEEVDEKVRSISAKLGIEGLLERPTHALSTGEKRRVALASVLVYEPDVLLLDEPTANVETRTVEALMNILCQLRGEGKTVLVATQRSVLAEIVADRVFVMNEGEIVYETDYPGDGRLRQLLDELGVGAIHSIGRVCAGGPMENSKS